MKDIIYSFLFPHFLQSLTVAATASAFPLIHPKNWKKRMLAGLLAAFLLGGFMEYMNTLFSPNAIGFLIIYYLAPVLLAYLFIFWITDASPAERIEALSLAYLIQHIGFCFSSPFSVMPEEPISKELLVLSIRWAIHISVAALVYHFVIRHLAREKHYFITLRNAIVTFVMVLLIALGLNYYYRSHISAGTMAYNIGLLYDTGCCIFFLWLQLEQQRSAVYWLQMETERKLRILNQDQYERIQGNVTMINQKCHDLKHQISALRLEKDPVLKEQGLKEMEKAVLIYDSVAKTGNKVLDTVLTEKSLICENNQITWTCMAEGDVLDFMSMVDLYTLFGNALDNAIEACLKIPDPDKRVVSVIVRKKSGMAVIQIENYYEAPVNLIDGFPTTTKQNPEEHGYGLQSIESIAQRYGGSMDIQTQDGVFLLSILLPVPIKK